MVKTHSREKLLNAIIFFAANTKYCGKTKLFKLLYLLDFDHFKTTGRSVTGLSYYAWEKGPVPIKLDSELDEPAGDLFEAVRIEPEQLANYQRLNIVPQREFDPSHFSNRELRLLDEIAGKYFEAKAGDMVEVTHAESGAWDKVWQDGQGKHHLIDYALALDGVPDVARIQQAAHEYSETLKRVGTA